uniref:Uncharacterized protein n=1 Tax=Glossina palpalis gambiensis TaxID=67801 RepID=A0A1B0AZU8_9MUSC
MDYRVLPPDSKLHFVLIAVAAVVAVVVAAVAVVAAAVVAATVFDLEVQAYKMDSTDWDLQLPLNCIKQQLPLDSSPAYWHLCYLGLCYSHLSLRLYLRVHYRQHQQHCSDDVESCDVFSCIPDSPVKDGDGDNSAPLSSCSILSLPVSLGELGVTPDVELTPTDGVLGGVVVRSPVLEPLSSTERSLQLLVRRFFGDDCVDC